MNAELDRSSMVAVGLAGRNRSAGIMILVALAGDVLTVLRAIL